MKKGLVFFFIFLILSILIKTDYRLEEGIYCCKDDHDYYAHAETIAIDFDFDYSNQFVGKEDQRFFYNGKSAPSTFFGTGLLSVPFLFLGNIIDNLYQNDNLYNFKLLLYSFSSIFYLSLTFVLTSKIAKFFEVKFSKSFLYIIILGSGIGFYAFERYSMSHVYEMFTITLLIYYCLRFYSEDLNNKLAFLIPFLTMLAIMTRWVNIYIFLIPLIVSKIIKNSKNKLFKNKFFWFSYLISIIVFLYHTYLIFGVVTINAEFTYNTSGTLDKFINSDPNLVIFVFSNLKNLILLLVGPEFGLIWFSPIIFFSFYLSLKNIFFQSQINKLTFLIILISMLQVFALVLIWKSAGSSYGFRYIMNLAPLSLIVTLSQKLNKVEILYIKLMSIFSAVSVLYFETTLKTQLSLEYTENMFGKITKFTQPDYLFGYINSFVIFESYLKIFAQSFFGFFIFYFFIKILGIDNFYALLDKFSLPYENSDFQNLIYKAQIIEPAKIFTTMILILICTYLILNLNGKMKVEAK